MNKRLKPIDKLSISNTPVNVFLRQFDYNWLEQQNKTYTSILYVEDDNKKYNCIVNNRYLLFNIWFDYIGHFSYGWARIKLNEKYNFITKENKLLSDIWFDGCDDFREYITPDEQTYVLTNVTINNQVYFINTYGNMRSDLPGRMFAFHLYRWDPACQILTNTIITLNNNKYKIDNNGNFIHFYDG